MSRAPITELCTVANGSGTVAEVDVTDVAVHCIPQTPQPPAMGTTFGDGVKATSTAPPIKAMALQPDGKILALGDLSLARYQADGSLDGTFGTGGVVRIVGKGGGFDTMLASRCQRLRSRPPFLGAESRRFESCRPDRVFRRDVSWFRGRD